MRLTPNTVKKFMEAPVEVRLWNGNFNNIEIIVRNNKKKYSLEMSDTHPLLREFSCVKEETVKFIEWETEYSGTHTSVPDELAPLLDTLREKIKMTDEYASEIFFQNVAARREFYDAFWPRGRYA